MQKTPTKSRLLEAVAQWAMQDIYRVALHSSGKDLTYFDLWQAANELAEQLLAQQTYTAGILLDNGIEWCIADLACIIAGIPSIPLPPFFSPQQQQHALSTSGANALIFYTTQWNVGPLDNAPVTLPEGTAKVTFTSGTTGEPKGVCLSQKGMESVAFSLLNTIGSEAAARHLALLPLPVLLENIAGLYTTLLAGGCYIVEPLHTLGFKGLRPDGMGLLKKLQQQKITSCILVPEYAQCLLAAMKVQDHRLPNMRFMAIGGAKVSEMLLREMQLRNLPVYQGYGLSEAASVVAVNTPSTYKPGSVGKVLPHVKCHLGGDGELILENPALLGYVGDAPHQGEYSTGDIVRVDEDEFLFIEGRKGNILITANGRNIAPEWPESELLAQPEILQALVYGEARNHLSALIVPATTDADITLAVNNANQQLPEYAQIKDWQEVSAFTMANGLLTANGRLKRKQILDYFEMYDSRDFYGKGTRNAFF